MLRNISTKFTSVVTRDMGVDSGNVNTLDKWEDARSNCLIAKAAAEINAEDGRLTIMVTQGVNFEFYTSPEIRRREYENALLAIRSANSVYPGTVQELVFHQTRTPDISPELVKTLQTQKGILRAMGLKIGAELFCALIEDEQPNQTLLQEIARHSDFIMCTIVLIYYSYPQYQPLEGAFESAAQDFLKYQASIKSANPNVDVILGPIGWSSYGISSYKNPNEHTVKNLRWLWAQVSKWSLKHKTRSSLIDAFDQPYKNNYNIQDKSNSSGKYGTQSHGGLWKRLSNDDIYSNIEKTEPITDNSTHSFKTSDDGSGTTVFIVVGTTIVLIFIVGVAIFQVFLKRKDVITQEEINAILNERSDSEVGTHAFSTYDISLEIKDSDIMIDKSDILGLGAFGIVFRGVLNGEAVAIKTLHSGAEKAYIITLLSELKTMIHLGKHPNLVSLVGAQTKCLRFGLLNVIVELCKGGSLAGWLADYKSKYDVTGNSDESKLTHQLLLWANQICVGMKFLEDKKVIHADLATRNVLLTGDNVAKVGDFGLSRKLYEYAVYVKKNQEPLPWRWMAIESLRRIEFSHKSDVWAFGVTLWEMYSLGDTPYGGIEHTTDFHSKLSDGLRLRCPNLAPQNIYQIMESCWQSDPVDRLTFEEVMNLLTTVENCESEHE